MTTSWPRHLVAALAAIGLLSSPLHAEPDAIRLRGVRPLTPRLLELMTRGYRQSPTFRETLDALAKISVIVHLVPADSLPGSLVGALQFVASRGHYRYLRILVRAELTDTVLIAAMAHELQHALEIARAPSIVDERSLRRFYRRAGHRSYHIANRECYDTPAARAIGRAVYLELSGAGAGSRTK